MTNENIANVLGALGCLLEQEVGRAVSASEREQTGISAIIHLSKYPGETVDALRVPTGLTHSGCVRLVDRLEQDGLVERRPGADGRTVAVHLKRKGRDYAAAALRRREAALASLLSNLSSTDRESLARIAFKLLRGKVCTERAGLRVCRLCDYDACESCPVEAACT
jgi:DNA-binding MarR family transcriptional regulator